MSSVKNAILGVAFFALAIMGPNALHAVDTTTTNINDAIATPQTTGAPLQDEQSIAHRSRYWGGGPYIYYGAPRGYYYYNNPYWYPRTGAYYWWR